MAYHGATSMWQGGGPGVLPAEAANEVGFHYNDLASVEKALISTEGDAAAIFVGSLWYPYSGQIESPTAEFARGLRDLADQYGAMLVVDEIRTNFRHGSTIAGGSWSELVPEG